MTSLETSPLTKAEPASRRAKLVLFHSPTSGRSRRAEGFLAQVLQRRHNHETFQIVRVNIDKRPDLAEKFGITENPTFLVIENNRVTARLNEPKGCRDLTLFLSPWLIR
jgi:thioredoxin-like negative regulator of GroEL